jgi:hypothetical protein
MKAKIVHMDPRALNHIQSELEATNQLGRVVLSSIDLARGSAMAVLPEEHLQDTYAFRSGIFARGGQERTPVAGGYVETVPSTQDAVSAWVHDVLGSDSHRAIVCESYLLRAGDLDRASLLPRRTVACGDFVYHWAEHGDSEQDVAAVVRMAYPVPLGFGVICTLPVEPAQLLGAATINPSSLSTIARSTDCIILGAYDGESVLVWMRDGAPFQILGVDVN